jgi:hypothetical protein
MPRFHPKVRRDVTTAIRHYDSISDAVDDFFVLLDLAEDFHLISMSVILTRQVRTWGIR